MAGKKLEWILSLVDRMSGPAGGASKNLAALEKRMREVDRASMLDRLNKTSDPLKREMLALKHAKSWNEEQLRTAGATESWVSKLYHGLGVVQMIGSALATVGRAMWGVAESVGRVLYDFTKSAIEAASFKENNLIAFKTILGTDAAADRVMQKLVKFAAVTPFETKQIMEIGKNLLVGGFKESELLPVLKAVGDVGAMKGFSQEIVDRLVSALSQVKARGKLTGEAMMRFAEAGVPAGKVYDKLAKSLGVTAEQAQKMMSAGRVGADQGIFAVVKTIRDDMSGGKLGNMMDRMSQTVSGLWSTLASKPFELMMDLGKSRGYSTLKALLGNAIGAIERYQPRIKDALEKVFTGTINAVFGDLAGADGPRELEGLLNRVLNFAQAVPPALTGFAAGLKAGLSGLFGDASRLFDGPMSPEKLTAIEQAFRRVGENIGKTADHIARLLGLLDKFVTVADYMSGHKLFSELYQRPNFVHVFDPTTGMDITDNPAAIDAAAKRMESERIGGGPTAAQIAGARGGTFAPQVHNEIHVHGADAASPEAIGRAVGKATDDSVSQWENMAMSYAGGTGG